MAEGDILHYILIVDSGATPTINLASLGTTSNEEEVPDAVVALGASDITSSSFTANWNFTENSQSYYLDVATDSAFTAFVAGYNNLSVGAVNEYSVVGLTDDTDYYYRIRGANDYGTGSSSNTIICTTLIGAVDFDGNIYTYVTIGSLVWMVENLKTTHYADGTVIPNITLDAGWLADSTGAYCWYNNDILNKTDYGALYNWYAVNNAHGLAPAGWRIPTVTDLDALMAFLGGTAVAGGILKEVGTTHWAVPNTGATDAYGFRGLPSGYRADAGTFADLFTWCHLWSVPQINAATAYNYELKNTSTTFSKNSQVKRNGFSIRCVRDV